MEPLITLRFLGSELNDAETHQLMNKILKICGKDEILSMLFNYYLAQYQKNGKHDDELSDINDSISSILNTREAANEPNDPSAKVEVIPIAINSMPAALIGECASYLKFRDYENFAQCDRKVYIGCYSPSRLVEIDFVNDYYECNLFQFPSIESLRLRIGSFNDYIASHPSQMKMSRLKHLNIDLENFDKTEIDKFLNHKCFDSETVTKLTCSGDGDRHSNPSNNFDNFIDFLSQFPNVSDLCLNEVRLADFNRSNSKISKLFPRLSGLNLRANTCGTIHSKGLAVQLLRQHSKQMVSIGCDDSFPNILFPMLKELRIRMDCMRNQHNKSYNHIQQNITKLEKITIVCGSNYIGSSVKKLILSLFQSANNLKYLCFRGIHTSQKFKELLECIEDTLHQTKSKIKHSLLLDFGWSRSPNKEFAETDIPRLIKAFDASNIQNFMVIFKTDLIETECEDFKSFLNSIKDRTKTHLYHCEESNRVRWQTRITVVVSNKGCKMNGYSSRLIL